MIRKGLVSVAKAMKPKNMFAVRALHTINRNNTFNTKSAFVNLYNKNQFCFGQGKITVEVPKMGDSITEGTIYELHKKEGDVVELDEIVAIIETDKVKVDIRAQEAGKILKFYSQEGETVEVGKQFYDLDTDAAVETKKQDKEAAKEKTPEQCADDDKNVKSERSSDQDQKVREKTRSDTPQEEKKGSQQQQAPKQEAPKQEAPKTQTKQEQPKPSAPKAAAGSRNERVEPMSRMRLKVAQRLKESQDTNVMLTTFQEADMSAVSELRKQLQEDFQKKHGVKLGFMSFFVKAAAHALMERPIVNAVIEGKTIKYRDYVDISVAVSTPSGLLIPVLRNVESMSFADVEKAILDFGARGKAGKITAEDMAGGTFTITNGGVFGSLLSTPIVNPPQSAILGMHNIVNRPVVVGDQIVARPMMYLAMTYDHRIIDGRDSVAFLKGIKQSIEDPRRLLLDL